MQNNRQNTTLMIVILLFALLAVFYLDSITDGTKLFAMMHPQSRYSPAAALC